MPAPRIYADFNGLVGERGAGWAVALDTFGTLRDLANAGVRLSVGLPLLVYDWSDEDEDLEADAIASFNSERGIWWADIGSEGYRYVPRKERDTSDVFRCVDCRARLDGVIGVHGLRLGDRCSSCSTPIHAPLIPP